MDHSFLNQDQYGELSFMILTGVQNYLIGQVTFKKQKHVDQNSQNVINS